MLLFCSLFSSSASHAIRHLIPERRTNYLKNCVHAVSVKLILEAHNEPSAHSVHLRQISFENIHATVMIVIFSVINGKKDRFLKVG